MTKFTKSFLWRFILDIILLGIFVRLMQNIILAILSRSMETCSTPFLVIEAVVVSVISKYVELSILRKRPSKMFRWNILLGPIFI